MNDQLLQTASSSSINPRMDPPSSPEIAERAFRRYLDRGATPGHDVDDWLWAETELRRERSAMGNELAVPVPEDERVRRSFQVVEV
jgi:hypothetical protein